MDGMTTPQISSESMYPSYPSPPSRDASSYASHAPSHSDDSFTTSHSTSQGRSHRHRQSDGHLRPSLGRSHSRHPIMSGVPRLHPWAAWIYSQCFYSARKRVIAHRIISTTLVLIIGIFLLGSLTLLYKAPRSSHFVIAARTITKGKIITEDDVTTTSAPSSLSDSPDTHAAMADSAHVVVGKIAPVTIHKGTLIPRSLIQDVPTVPSGFTSVDVTLASSSESFHVGDTIALMSADDTLSRSAIILHIPETTTSTPLWEVDAAKTASLTVALPAHDALTVLQAQNKSPIIAVPVSDDHNG